MQLFPYFRAGGYRHGLTQIVRVMKITTVLLLAACLTASATGKAQKISLSLRNATLEKALAEIKRQTGYDVIYTVDVLQRARPVTIDLDKADLSYALDQCFQDQPLTYTILEKVIVVKLRPPSVEEGPVSITVPPIDVRGRVVNEKGEPVVGASVQVKGDKTKGTTTDENGYFELRGVDETAVLVIGGVNIEKFEAKVNGNNVLSLIAKNKVTEGEEVTILATGYQEIPKERATGSFIQIGKELLNRSVSPDILSRIDGIASSTLFDPTLKDDVYRNPGISIRGRSTIFSNTTPLIVLDNFPYYGNISNINPNDIENVTILKDAAAASIWGVQSGNGVIVITTKKGKYGKPLSVSFNSIFTVSEKPDLFYDQNFLNSTDFIDFEKYQFDNGFYDFDLLNLFGTFQPISPAVRIYSNLRDGLISNNDAENQIIDLKRLDIRNDLKKYFYRRGFDQQYALNISGGSDNVSYFFSTGYDKSLSSIIGNETERITLNSLNKFTPLKNLEITAGITYAITNTHGDNTLAQIKTEGSPRTYRNIYPYAELATEDGTALPIIKNYDVTYTQSVEDNGFLNWQFYPLNELRNELNTSESKRHDIRLSGGIKYAITKGLNIQLDYLHQRAYSEVNNHAKVNSYYARDIINHFSIVSSMGNVIGYNVPKGGILETQNSDYNSNTIRGMLNLEQTWNKVSLSAVTGFEVREFNANSSLSTLYGYDENTNTFQHINPLGYFFPLNPFGDGPITYNTLRQSTTDRFRSYLLNASLGFDNRYIVSVSGRIDGSNLFGVRANQKSVPLWSAGVKWNINKEKFFSSSLFTQLAFRATYGYNGNVNKSISAYTTAYITSAVDINGSPYNYANILLPGNPDLQWEKIGMLNIALDFGLKNSIFNGTVEYYHKNGKDIIGDAANPSSSGFTSIRGNFAEVSGHGIDIVLRTRVNLGKQARWEPSFLFNYVTDKVIKYTGVTPDLGLLIGRPVNGIYSYRWGGLDPINGNPMGYIDNVLSEDYGILTNIQLKDKIYNGTAQPTIFGGFLNSFSWRQFSLSANIIYKARYFFRRNSISYNQLVFWKGHSDYANRWQKPGDENSTSVPSIPVFMDASRDNFYLGSEALVEKGDHIRLQDINFSYTLSKVQWEKCPFNNITFFIYANNLGIIWRANKMGIDPDFKSGFPNPRGVSLGVRTTL